MKLDDRLVRRAIDSWLAEDIGRADVTTLAVVPASASGRARIEARSPAVLAGLDVAAACFEAEGAGITWRPQVADGDRVESGSVIAYVDGPLRTILTAERTALNILGRMSGVATVTAQYVQAVSGTPALIVDTRKTTPGLRIFEKYAVRMGGGRNHRFGLDDGVLIKDNHIAAAGGVAPAVEAARRSVPHGLKVEVEITDLESLDEALAAGADAVLLDNMSPESVRSAVLQAGGKVLLEASGGITLDNVWAFAEAGVDLISIGALTHSAPAADLSLEVEVSEDGP